MEKRLKRTCVPDVSLLVFVFAKSKCIFPEPSASLAVNLHFEKRLLLKSNLYKLVLYDPASLSGYRVKQAST